MNVSVPAPSEKDCADLEFALGLRVDIVALSLGAARPTSTSSTRSWTSTAPGCP
jgi:pyruvate kinase